MKKTEIQQTFEKKDAITIIKQLIIEAQDTTEADIRDVFYIGEKITMMAESGSLISQKHEISRCYWVDFVLKNRKEAKQILDEKHMRLPSKYNESDFFVYNEKTGELNPFQQGDCLMYPGGYVMFDGKEYINIDDNGNELTRFLP